MLKYNSITFEHVFSNCFPLSDVAKNYLEGRGLNLDESNTEVFTYCDLEGREYLAFPIVNHLWDDGVVSFYLRSLSGKEHLRINSPSQPSYYLGLTDQALQEIIKVGFVIVVEGPIDRMSLSPFLNVLAQSSNKPSSALVRDLVLLKTPIRWIFDMDKAGWEIGRDRAKVIGRRYDLKIREEPIPYKDVNDFLQNDPVLFRVWKKKLFR